MATTRKKPLKKTQTGRGKDAIVPRSEAEHWIRETIKVKEQLEQQLGALDALVGCDLDSPFNGAMWAPFNTLVVAVSELIGDSSEALGWFLWDNGCGGAARKHTLPDGSEKQIETVHDILDVMGY